MKYYIIIICTALSLSSCDVNYIRDQHKHELRKFNVKNTVGQNSSAWYFLVMGGYSSSKTENTKVRFYFKNCSGEFQFMELSLEEVKVQIDTTNNPFVTFEFSNSGTERTCTDRGTWNVRFATIHCSERDFQPEININDLR